MEQHPYILMLEDDPDDRYLTDSIVREANISIPLEYSPDTENIIDTISGRPPVLILIDFNLNPETGLEVLKRLKRDKRFLHIPVIILGDSSDPYFTAECYRNGVNSYIVKPSSIEETRKKITVFFKYWLEVAECNGLSSIQKPLHQ